MRDKLLGRGGRRTGLVLSIATLAVLLTCTAVGASSHHGKRKEKGAIVRVVVPVVPCQVRTGVPSSEPTFTPGKLPAYLPASLKGKVDFYSTGSTSVLGPKGWDCTALYATDGGAGLTVAPPGEHIATATPKEIIRVALEYTGHVPGIDLVCPYFPPAKTTTSSTTYPGCKTSPPTGEVVTHPTTYMAAFKAAAGFEGRPAATTGVLIYPSRLPPNLASSVNVSYETCSVPVANVCKASVADFEIRDFPAVPRP